MDFKRLYTRHEAEQTLPLVRQIVDDILETGDRLGRLEEGTDEWRGLREELGEQMSELEELGCYYKDWGFSIGLVDFPAVIDGEVVFLCWRSDENRLGWYHRIDAGYLGRTPLPAEFD